MVVVGAGGGGGTENKARSCASVSRINDVISWLERRAFVKIFGLGNLKTHTRQHSFQSVKLQFHLRQRVDAFAAVADLLEVRVQIRHDCFR